MTTKQIIIDYLTANGFDGLAGDHCGCGVDDLAPCGREIPDDCKPARKTVCTGCGQCDDEPGGDCWVAVEPQKE